MPNCPCSQWWFRISFIPVATFTTTRTVLIVKDSINGKDITEAVSKNAGAPKENIHVIVNELKKDRYAQGGEWKK